MKMKARAISPLVLFLIVTIKYIKSGIASQFKIPKYSKLKNKLK
jgi:hypothetical protein